MYLYCHHLREDSNTHCMNFQILNFIFEDTFYIIILVPSNAISSYLKRLNYWQYRNAWKHELILYMKLLSKS